MENILQKIKHDSLIEINQNEMSQDEMKKIEAELKKLGYV